METQQNPKKAMWLSLIPGLGQIYNKQKAKGYMDAGQLVPDELVVDLVVDRAWFGGIVQTHHPRYRPWTR